MNWDPIKGLIDVQERVNRIFQDTFQGENTTSGEWTPPVDILETESDVVILVELPGVSEDSIAVDIKNDILSIRGEKCHPIDIEKNNYYRLERNFGKFIRSFKLPAVISKDDIKASLKDGVLTIELKKDVDNSVKTVKITKG